MMHRCSCPALFITAELKYCRCFSFFKIVIRTPLLLDKLIFFFFFTAFHLNLMSLLFLQCPYICRWQPNTGLMFKMTFVLSNQSSWILNEFTSIRHFKKKRTKKKKKNLDSISSKLNIDLAKTIWMTSPKFFNVFIKILCEVKCR